MDGVASEPWDLHLQTFPIGVPPARVSHVFSLVHLTSDTMRCCGEPHAALRHAAYANIRLPTHTRSSSCTIQPVVHRLCIYVQTARHSLPSTNRRRLRVAGMNLVLHLGLDSVPGIHVDADFLWRPNRWRLNARTMSKE